MQTNPQRWNWSPNDEGWNEDYGEDYFDDNPLDPPSGSTVTRFGRSTPPQEPPFLSTLLEPPARFVPALGDAIAWISIALLLRLGIEHLFLNSMHFWLPGILMLSTPALLALMIVTYRPQLSWVVGYRLILLMFGLLLGGRL